MALDVLDDDDGVVGDEPDSRGDARQGHQVDGLARDPQRETDDRHGERDRRDGHEHEAEAP